MMNMDIVETTKDSTIYLSNTKVIWGIKADTIAFMWDDSILLYFSRVDHTSKKDRIKKRKLQELLVLDDKEDILRHVILRDIYYNQWDEMFLITIYMVDGTVIFINRLDDNFPHYTLQLIHPQ